MSYCRWSSDGFQSDLYCYEDMAGGWTTHVAGGRHPKRLCGLDFSSDEALAASIEQQRAELDDPGNAPIPIGLPHDGETFNDPTLWAFLDRVLMLRDAGYHVSAQVVARICAEIEEVA